MKKGFLIILALILVVIGAYFVSETYARYTESILNSGSATVAKWAFGADNSDTTLKINLNEGYHASTLAENKIAPGTSGSFVIALSNENTEVAVDVTVAITKENAPHNLKFYTDAACNNELGDTLTAVIAAGEKLEDKTIYWKWDYNNTADTAIDEKDTENGKEALTMTVGLAITGTQKTSSATEITTGWN